MPLPPGVLGNAIREERIRKHLSQERLAEMLGISSTHLKHIESEHRKASLDVLFNIVQILDMSLDAIMVTPTEENKKLKIKIEHMINLCDNQQLSFVYSLLKVLHENEYDFIK